MKRRIVDAARGKKFDGHSLEINSNMRSIIGASSNTIADKVPSDLVDLWNRFEAGLDSDQDSLGLEYLSAAFERLVMKRTADRFKTRKEQADFLKIPKSTYTTRLAKHSF